MNTTKQCYFCNNNVKHIDYKDVDALKKFMNPYARMLSTRKTNTCSLHQRKLATAIKRARFIALVPFVSR
ncbi:MAG: 30S ribosomal protein S18 [Candidatus Vogelbacteria bacterium]|nr:30S ribosomal protein S18 [Candidatus Vogelbacteria bacterium]